MSWQRMKGGWKIRPKLEGDPEYAREVQEIARVMRERSPRLPKPVKPEGMSREDWIFSMQQPSTKVIIEKQKDPNYKRDWTEPLPDNVQIIGEDGKVDIGERELTADEILNYHSPGKYNTLGQSDKSAISEECRERAIHHFLVSPPAALSEEEKKRIQSLTDPAIGISASIPRVWKRLTFWQAIAHWIKGGKVQTIKEDGRNIWVEEE